MHELNRKLLRLTRKKRRSRMVCGASIVLSLLSLSMAALGSNEADSNQLGRPELVVASIKDIGLVPRPAQHLGRGNSGRV